MTSLAAQLLHDSLHLVFAFYALVVMSHFALQIFFADRGYRKALRARERRGPLSALPEVDVVITSYNEDPEHLRSCLESLARQDYPGVTRVYVVDDCSANRAELQPVGEELQKHHEGSREAPGYLISLPVPVPSISRI